MTRTLLLLALLLVLPGCSESPSPLSPDPEPVTRHTYTLVLTEDNVHPGDKSSAWCDYWLIPINEPIDSVQVTVTTQLSPDSPILFINDCVSLVPGYIKVYRVAGRVGPPLKVSAQVTDMRVAKVSHNQGGSW